ncbi:MAG: hypothetical protein R3B60_02870 [Candidatus Paceibacterota bacterium]
MPSKTTKKTAKKPVAKKVVKKIATKTKVAKTSAKKTTKSTTKKVSKNTKPKVTVKVLVYASDDQSFWVNDGQIINNLMALQEALTNMDQEVFGYHVNSEKNDFADWVDGVLCDSDCATDLRKTKGRDKACQVVAKHLKTYTV